MKQFRHFSKCLLWCWFVLVVFEIGIKSFEIRISPANSLVTNSASPLSGGRIGGGQGQVG